MSIQLRREQLRLGDDCFTKLMDYKDQFKTVVDIGGGDGRHAKRFAGFGKHVTLVDINPTCDKQDNIHIIRGDFMEIGLEGHFDVLWLSHVVEHQQNVGLFLEMALSVVKPNGFVCVIVPPAKHQIVGGHLTLWNAGLLLYNLVLAGQDCSDARVLENGYNISVICKRKPAVFPREELRCDYGDINMLRDFFPKKLEWWDDSFFGDIKELNWY